MIVTDLQGTITHFNRAAPALFGWSAEEAVGRNVVELTVPEALTEAAREILARVARGETWSGEFECKHRDATLLSIMMTESPMLDARGRPVGIVGASTDVRELKRTENALREGDRQKSEFLAMLSHELRHPLARSETAFTSSSAANRPAIKQPVRRP